MLAPRSLAAYSCNLICFGKAWNRSERHRANSAVIKTWTADCGLRTADCGHAKCGVPKCGHAKCGLTKCGVSICGVSKRGHAKCGLLKKMIGKKISKIIIKNKIKLQLNNYNSTTQCNFPYFPLECPSSQLLAHGRH